MGMNDPTQSTTTPMSSSMAAREELLSGALWEENAWVNHDRVRASTRLADAVEVWTYCCYGMCGFTILWGWYHFAMWFEICKKKGARKRKIDITSRA